MRVDGEVQTTTYHGDPRTPRLRCKPADTGYLARPMDEFSPHAVQFPSEHTKAEMVRKSPIKHLWANTYDGNHGGATVSKL